MTSSVFQRLEPDKVSAYLKEHQVDKQQTRRAPESTAALKRQGKRVSVWLAAFWVIANHFDARVDQRWVSMK